MRPELKQFLERPRPRGGCGLVARPSFYTDRGVQPGDLDVEDLVRVHQEIVRLIATYALPQGADAAFRACVQGLPYLTATDFLLNLEALDARNFAASPRPPVFEVAPSADNSRLLAADAALTARMREEFARRLEVSHGE